MSNAKLIKALAKVELNGLDWQKDPVTGERHLVDVVTFPHVFERDGVIHVSAEHGDGAADYYGETVREHVDADGNIVNAFGIHQGIIDAAESVGMHWEWINPGCIGAYK